MSNDPGSGWALQKAIVASLAGDAALKAMIGDPARVSDGPARVKIFPYIVLAETRETALQAAPGHVEHDIRLSVHSRYEGRREVKEIVTRIVSVLNDAALAIEGRRLVSLRSTFSDTIYRTDADAHQGLVRLRAVTAAV